MFHCVKWSCGTLVFATAASTHDANAMLKHPAWEQPLAHAIALKVQVTHFGGF